MKPVILVYQTDVWHTHSSYELVAICTSKQKAISTIKKFIKETYKAKLTEHDIYHLNTINQTQSSSEDPYPFEGEFVLEETAINTILI